MNTLSLFVAVLLLRRGAAGVCRILGWFASSVRVLFRVPLFFFSIVGGQCLFVGIEGSQSAASPSGAEVGGCCVLQRSISVEEGSDIEESAEEGCAIVVDEFDQSGLLHQATEFDEVSCSGASVLG